MVTWIIYDISRDRIRNRVAKLCLRAGLYRVQESVFLGDLETNRMDELKLQFNEWIDAETDSIFISPISSDDFVRIQILGQGFDEELIAATKKQMFF